MKSTIIFTAFERTWRLDPDDRIHLHGESGPGAGMKASLQILVDAQRGLHVPSRTVLDRAFSGVVPIDIVEVREIDGPASDIES